ncbi:Voltage-dependent calcium channel subunit alpha-2 delta-2 [Paramuricea clavata]|uniref:Voltage-dependent calcium channel subunit alpha-2 delta-2 n=1 Tax=Paramuricea clavata TaxID=317549 RepID=A0A7D9DV11_PARCT|nr:Voltage-dependent calcium channel subunit alpha-2 delta-2 [Paramuricea clavata]
MANFEDLSCQDLWFKTGVKDRQRYIPIHDIHLLLFHVLTGCDCTSALSGIGKKKALNVLLKNEWIQQDLSNFGKNPVIEEFEQKVTESFICSIYTSAQEFLNSDDARYFLFCQRNLKSEELPPTSESLSHHIKRANFQACVWNRALHPFQSMPASAGNGWKLEDGKLVPVLMTQNPVLEGIVELTTCPLHNFRVQTELFL